MGSADDENSFGWTDPMPGSVDWRAFERAEAMKRLAMDMAHTTDVLRRNLPQAGLVAQLARLNDNIERYLDTCYPKEKD